MGKIIGEKRRRKKAKHTGSDKDIDGTEKEGIIIYNIIIRRMIKEYKMQYAIQVTCTAIPMLSQICFSSHCCNLLVIGVKSH